MKQIIKRGLVLVFLSFAFGLVVGIAQSGVAPIAIASDPGDLICDETLPCEHCVPCEKEPPGMVLCAYYEGTWYNTKTHQYLGCCQYITSDPDCHYPW